ncbi:MAG: hypothetical protein HDQ93_06880 [Desulfovibrio sp.]|nr:hypothetical protein [Desulfovibrio sp.]
MKELGKDILVKFALPILASMVIGIGSSILSCLLVTERMNGRVTSLETQIAKHEHALDRDFQRHEQTVAILANRTDDQERRLTRLEALVGETQALLAEIRTDVKILLRGGQQ